MTFDLGGGWKILAVPFFKEERIYVFSDCRKTQCVTGDCKGNRGV